jgi:hypothetical protein
MQQPECYNDKCIEIYLTLINLRNFCDEKGANKKTNIAKDCYQNLKYVKKNGPNVKKQYILS